MTPAEVVKFIMLQMTPCTLHVETRIVLKVLTLILQDGLSNARGGLLSSTHGVRSQSRRGNMFKISIDELFNIEILGDSVNKYQCGMRLEDDPNGTGRRLGVINFENSKVRKKLCSIDKIIDACHINNDI